MTSLTVILLQVAFLILYQLYSSVHSSVHGWVHVYLFMHLAIIEHLYAAILLKSV